MPNQRPIRFDIETAADAEAQTDKLMERLGVWHPAVRMLAACEYDDLCDRSSCPRCSHQFREDVLLPLAALFDQPLDRLRFVTVYVREITEGKLGEVEPEGLRDSLRHVIARADPTGRGLAIGAIEPEWCATERKWLLHLHVISSDIDKPTWNRVRGVVRKRAYKGLGKAIQPQAGRVLRNDPVGNLAYQLSYCIKFVSYDRLPRGENGAKGKAVPLKGHPLHELIDWRSRYSPRDFLFLYGAKGLNGRFVRMLPRN